MKDQLPSQMNGSLHDLKAALVEKFSNQIDILIQQHIVAVERCLDDTLKTLERTAAPPQTPQLSDGSHTYFFKVHEIATIIEVYSH